MRQTQREKRAAAANRCPGGLLQKLQYRLLSLIGLLQCGHAGGLQNVVLRHAGHRLAHISIHDAVGSTGQILYLAGDHVGGRGEPVDRGADLTALRGNAGNCVVDGRQRCRRIGRIRQ